ncbi:MAG: hypothetical protein K2F71_05430, partial [Paramuribaculum sp.]|nr:hypothetical protein [Paramuribaculum sp.]
METISLTPSFITQTTDIEPLRNLEFSHATESEMRHATGNVDFLTAYDFFRAVALEKIEAGNAMEAVERILAIDDLLGRMPESGMVLDTHTALMQVLTAVYLSLDNLDEAMKSAARALNLLAQSPKRKDEPFLSVLAALLHDISLIHLARGEYKQAEREIEKSIRIFERLAKLHPERYGSAQIMAANAATSVYRSRQRQTELLAEIHERTAEYLRQVNDGIGEAVSALIDSMAGEGETLMKMGRTREALQYFSRALKYLTNIEPDFTLRQLMLSISLGEALLASNNTREKGIHLLNTMLHKATRLHAADQHRRIVDIL